MQKINIEIPTPLPRVARFEHLAYGMFIHWGLYSQLGQGEWIQYLGKWDASKYVELQNTFTAKDFDARAIARLAREAGMKYITLTTRHHEGFSLYDTRGLSKFDALHAPAGRDLAQEFVEGCRAEGITPFFYHTTIDWHFQKNWKSGPDSEGGEEFDDYLDYFHASVELLCRNYGPIGGLWFDGNWAHPKADWKEDRLYGMIRKYQPEAMIINNTGIEHQGGTGHPELDSVTYEQGLPKLITRMGKPKYLAGEMCQTMNQHWGVGEKDFHYLSPGQIIENLCLSRKVGANYLLNVGPTGTGAIPEYEQAALRRSGQWVELYAEILRDGSPCEVICQGRDFVLSLQDKHYYFAFDLSVSGDQHVTVAEGGTGPRTLKGELPAMKKVSWFDNLETISFMQHSDKNLAVLDLTGYPYGTNLVVRVAEILYK